MVEQQFTHLLKEYPDALNDRKRFAGLLRDLLPGLTLQANLLLYLHEIDLHREILAAYRLDNAFVYRFIKRLQNSHGISEENAFWGIRIWCECYGEIILNKSCEFDYTYKPPEFTTESERNKTSRRLKHSTETTVSVNPDDEIGFSKNPTTRFNFDAYYLNTSYDKTKDIIYIPCGMGMADYGYFIHGIAEDKKCTHKFANIYALIYNYTIRNSRMELQDEPKYFKSIQMPFQVDYLNVFRLITIVLQLIKNNYITDSSVCVQYDGDINELMYALEIINNYASLFCRLIGIPTTPPLKHQKNNKAISISFSSSTGIFIKKNETPCNARELWYGQKINYRLSEKNLSDLEYILCEISPFDGFREGQFDALCSMLASDGHSICIMPTGRGKSLIYYMASLLQPLPVFIIAPTEILIIDQIRNLRKFHRIDNLSHLKLSSENDFSRYEVYNSLQFLTPTTFQNRNLLVKFRNINTAMQVSYIVLDEVHCLSSWGHDFRPEYLMLSKNLKTFLNRASFLGFTATANYTVMEDIKNQLSIPLENIFSPISYENYNVNYNFYCVKNSRELYDKVCEIATRLINRDERTLIFTKNDRISDIVVKGVGFEADILKFDNTDAYESFANEKSKVLVTTGELGIGVNLPNVRSIIHVGLPVSKNEYVQEVGRAGRAYESVNSYVVYIDKAASNVPQHTLQRGSPTENITIDFPNNDNDYVLILRRICNDIKSRDELFDQLLTLYSTKGNIRYSYRFSFPINQIEYIKKQLYILYAIGCIDDWYAYSVDDAEGTIDIMIAVSDESIQYGSQKKLSQIKRKAQEYFDFLGNSREQIFNIQHAESADDIIRVYVDWYYSRLLFNNREMFLDLLEFIEKNANCDSEAITKDIKDYFSLPFVKIKSDEMKYANLSQKEIGNLIEQGISRESISNIERLNSSQYVYSYDLILFLVKLRFDRYFDDNRLNRILSRTAKGDLQDLIEAVIKIYKYCSYPVRFEIHKGFNKHLPNYGIPYKAIFNLIYETTEVDMVYYGVLATTANEKYSSITGRV